MTPVQRVLTSQGWPAGYADTLPEDVTEKLAECIDANSGLLVKGVRERVSTIMREHYESLKATAEPPEQPAAITAGIDVTAKGITSTITARNSDGSLVADWKPEDEQAYKDAANPPGDKTDG
jgi:hypothetical protein